MCGLLLFIGVQISGLIIATDKNTKVREAQERATSRAIELLEKLEK